MDSMGLGIEQTPSIRMSETYPRTLDPKPEEVAYSIARCLWFRGVSNTCSGLPGAVF